MQVAKNERERKVRKEEREYEKKKGNRRRKRNKKKGKRKGIRSDRKEYEGEKIKETPKRNCLFHKHAPMLNTLMRRIEPH